MCHTLAAPGFHFCRVRRLDRVGSVEVSGTEVAVYWMTRASYREKNMQDKPKRANAKKMSELKTSLDLDAVAAALQAGEITSRQAKNATRFIEVALDIRNNPLYAVEDGKGQFIGEFHRLPDGNWRARRYGKEFKTGGVIVSSEDEAIAYVKGVWPSEPPTGKVEAEARVWAL